MIGTKTKKVNLIHRREEIGYIIFNKRLHFAIEGSKKICLDGRPLKDWQKAALLSALTIAGGNRKEAAAILRVGERTVYRMCKEYSL